ncbi:MAG TPA: acetyl-CoA carboxylase biotin carboxyl carrier protein subunit [Paludibacteraceae bacterium]|jgi:biotin carboxyl carrier protein|nr:acetyl-CoA carboxylase biotin carboxyl carrier protein subunit [Paludibacteraceae bacterium]HOU66996.1 acetyl-CoA carboxylase biotin carboxyl carrier protein subunit [Paludibacteraceae bacterium]HPH62398.1 acetyl-CoA carboxylase biotin carboxyl carrier protein subunit [Paludibacteraceae bacterium]HQF49199.1 acetyl-CoA carboxylase biotin carboxyl carrier protein subunit [Paludibacteraceae bacterium]HQJ89752.1 acetyl-CoA carboxylase biotin carboxyl carrier protein subunit [Paludibacteraceae ba
MSEEKQELVDLTIEEGTYKTLLTEKFKMKKKYEPKNTDHVYSIIPGTILKFFVKEGDTVKAGSPLLILEAMKMENIIKMPFDGKIRKILVSDGVRIAKDTLMVELDK